MRVRWERTSCRAAAWARRARRAGGAGAARQTRQAGLCADRGVGVSRRMPPKGRLPKRAAGKRAAKPAKHFNDSSSDESSDSARVTSPAASGESSHRAAASALMLLQVARPGGDAAESAEGGEQHDSAG